MTIHVCLSVLLLALAVPPIFSQQRASDFLNFREAPGISLGGVTCAVCTVVTGLVDQLAVVHSETHTKAFSRLCGIFPSPFSGLCGTFRLIYGGRINKLLDQGATPDSVCIGIGMCAAPVFGKQMCHLYPSKLLQKSAVEVQRYFTELLADIPTVLTRTGTKAGFCSIPLIGALACGFLNTHAFSIQYPKDDGDKDGFSSSFTLRGSAWRGKDCKDNSAATYPGRQPLQNDVSADSNCNGISGKSSTLLSYEEELCGNSSAKGVIALGDSVTANFHIPGSWFNASMVNAALYKNLTLLMDNSFNWPHTSLFTGFQNVDWPIMDGATDSIYLRMRERNLCNHRDYQNVGFNGARIIDGQEYSQTLKRSGQDKPAIVIFSYIGNDVCKYSANPADDQTTTPTQAREGLLATMAVLNSKLPPGSHAVVVGVADARPFFDSLRSKIHPFGALRSDVTYLNFYDWLTCIGINPCSGWLTADETIRAVTAQRVSAINIELEKVVNENKNNFANVEMVYLPNPVDEVLASWSANGGESWQLVEEFDGFHPNQRTHKLAADVVWNRLLRDYPNVLGPVNLYNDRIRALFGDQGGH